MNCFYFEVNKTQTMHCMIIIRCLYNSKATKRVMAIIQYQRCTYVKHTERQIYDMKTKKYIEERVRDSQNTVKYCDNDERKLLHLYNCFWLWALFIT